MSEIRLAKAEFLYDGSKIIIHCNEDNKLERIIQKFCTKIQKNQSALCFLYGGKIIDMNLTFTELANSLDKKRLMISIIVTDCEKDDNSILLKEIKKLKEQLAKGQNIIENQKKEIEELKYKVTLTKSEGMTQINSLMKIIEEKDQLIEKLKSKPKKINFSDVIAVKFKSTDSKIDFPMACLATENFVKIEEKLYQEYPELRRNNNCFLCRGKIVNRFLSIKENGIKSGDIIIVVTEE